MPRRSLRLVFILLCTVLPFSAAQTQTLANPDGNGGSIVQVVTTDIDGLPVTDTINTIPPGALTAPAPDPADPTTALAIPGAQTTTTTPGVPAVPTTATRAAVATTATRAQTTTPGNLGPVPQPPATTPVGEGITTYQYTTVDALGQTQTIQDTFTPTYNTPSPMSSPAKGTVLSPSQFSAMIGTHTAGGPTGGAVSWRITPTGAGGALVLMCGLIAGALAVL